MAFRVALPILHVSVRLRIVKGRPWSVMEHAILATVSKEQMGVRQIAEAGSLPYRLVIEALIRLMRAGWVELVEEPQRVLFRATATGRRCLQGTELPRIAMPISRIGLYAVDKFTGTCFRAREMKIYRPRRIDEFVQQGTVLRLEPPKMSFRASQVDALDALTEEDEEIRGIDDIGTRESERYALLTVRGKDIDGLPGGAPDSLRNVILSADRNCNGSIVRVAEPPARQRDPYGIEEAIEIAAAYEDIFIVGGEAHRTAIIKALREAKSWIVIHSTFLNNEAFNLLANDIVAACDRGVRVDILWGQSEASPSRGQTLREIRRLTTELQTPGSAASISISPFSTGSHAKVVLYDSATDSMVGIVGSCNWLSTQYGSLEVSLRLRDPRIVNRLAGAVAELARPLSGHWSPLSRDLAACAVNLRRRSQEPHRTRKKLRARIVLSASHNDMVLHARDHAHNRIVFGSHRLGVNAQSLAFDPMRAAVCRRNLAVDMYVGQFEPDIGPSGNICQYSADEHPMGRIEVRLVKQVRLHAKFVYWDDNDVVITSQNPLSADPADRHSLGELGVHLAGPGIARYFNEAFLAALGR